MDNLKCPHCEAIQDTTDWIELGGCDGADFEVECGKCQTIFEVLTSIQVSYTTERILSDEYVCIDTLNRALGRDGLLLLNKHSPEDHESNLRAKAMVSNGFMYNRGTEGAVRYFQLSGKGYERLIENG